MSLELLCNHSAKTLSELSLALRQGGLRHGVTAGLLESYVGRDAKAISSAMKVLTESGTTPAALALMCDAIGKSNQEREALDAKVRLVLSGPDVSGSPVTSTGAMVQSLFTEAKSSILLASYAFYDAKDIFAPLVARVEKHPEFQVSFVIDLSHHGDRGEPLPVLEGKFRKHFREHVWPGDQMPDVWYDCRVFEPRGFLAAMHAKVLVADKRTALIGSANFTSAAHNRNIETGVLLRDHPDAKRIYEYFEGMKQVKTLAKLVW